MEYRRLGRTGLKVSPLCLGTMQWGWTASEAESFAVMDAFVEAGGNFLDTANLYTYWVENGHAGMCEEIIGRWMQARGNRREIVVATKVLGPMWDSPNGEGLSRAHIIRACEDSLRRMQTDYIDLYQTHYPDPETPIEETLEALDTLVRQGKVRYLGCSNYLPRGLTEALWTSDKRGLARFDSIQLLYNLLHRVEYEFELRQLCLDYGLGVLPYSPLANGFLTGKYRQDVVAWGERASWVQRYLTERNWRTLEVVREIAAELDSTPATVSLAWLLARPGVTSLVFGANSPAQLRDSLAAMTLELDVAHRERLEEATSWRDLLPELWTEPPRVARYHEFGYSYPAA